MEITKPVTEVSGLASDLNLFLQDNPSPFVNSQPWDVNVSPNLSDSLKTIDLDFFDGDWKSSVTGISSRVIVSQKTAPGSQDIDDYLLNYSEDIARASDCEILPDSNYEVYVTESSSIPPSLMPWPELLLNVTHYRKLLHFWVTEGSTFLCPAPWMTQIKNPFKIYLSLMAMEYSSVMTVLLAFAAKIRSQLTGQQEAPKQVIDQLLSRSCTELIRLLDDKSTSTNDCTLATILLLLSYEAFNSRDMGRHRIHARGARKLINTRLKQVTHNMSDISYFLMRWFIYIDVVGGLLTTKDYHLYCGDNEKYQPAQILGSCCQGIDSLTGMEIDLYPKFARISYLIQATESFQAHTGLLAIPSEVVVETMTIKNDIDLLMMTPAVEHPIHALTNKLFCYMAIITLYRRILGIKREHPLVQDVVDKTYQIYKFDITPRSLADLCTVACSFVVGCEAWYQHHQSFFRERMLLLAANGNTSASKGIMVMDRCWATGETMTEAAGVLDIDVALM